MNTPAEKISQAIPERRRPYVTFRLATALVAALAVWNVAFSVFMKPQVSRFDGRHRGFHQLLQSPYFLVPYNIGIAVGFWIIYVTRGKTKYYHLRVYCYGMLLGGVVGELLSLLR